MRFVVTHAGGGLQMSFQYAAQCGGRREIAGEFDAALLRPHVDAGGCQSDADDAFAFFSVEREFLLQAGIDLVGGDQMVAEEQAGAGADHQRGQQYQQAAEQGGQDVRLLFVAVRRVAVLLHVLFVPLLAQVLVIVAAVLLFMDIVVVGIAAGMDIVLGAVAAGAVGVAGFLVLGSEAGQRKGQDEGGEESSRHAHCEAPC